ncbi:hypothetical protein BD769DRAFT_1664932 [Suillus cothurnatus]|nr:hypothetical protein BD769DRAFT_1664932 [Suillus cothurnatus]
MVPKRKRQTSSSHQASFAFNLHPSTSESKQMDNSRKSGSKLAVNSIFQELLGDSAGSSNAYRKANSEVNQGLKSASQLHSRSKAKMVPKSKSTCLPDFQFVAGEILFIPCGTKQSKKTSHSYIPLLTPVLHNPQIPTLVEVQSLEQELVFVLFDLELRKFFPRLFLYLNALPKLPNPDYQEHQDEIF